MARIRSTTSADVEAGRDRFATLIQDRWKDSLNRRSFVALDEQGNVIGHTRAIDNTFHPTSRVFMLEMVEELRGSAVEDELMRAQIGASDLPLTMKIHDDQLADQALAHRFGGVVYQLCPPWEHVVDDELLAWARERDGGAEPVGEEDRVEALELFVHHYWHQHQEWSIPSPIEVLREEFVDDFISSEPGYDPRYSYILRRGGRIVAGAFLWPGDDDVDELTCHTLSFESPQGCADMEVCLAAAILAMPHGKVVGIDAHRTWPLEWTMVEAIPGGTGVWTALVSVPGRGGQVAAALDPSLIPDEAAWVRRI